MDVKSRDFNFEIDDLNNDGIKFTKISLGKEEYMTGD